MKFVDGKSCQQNQPTHIMEGVKMKVDKIIKNAKIFTSDKDNILASALVVKDGKFV